MSLDEPRLRVFVYGTLKRGHRNHERYCTGVVSIESAQIIGQLYHLPQGYPMLDVPPDNVLSLGSHDGLADARRQDEQHAASVVQPNSGNDVPWRVITGELLTFNDPASRLVALDGLEGYAPATTSGHYQRALVELLEPVGMLAWTYIAPDGRLPPGAVACDDDWDEPTLRPRIRYQLQPDLSATEFIDLLERSTLAERRPVANRAVIEQMLRGADVVLTARDADGCLVGVARALTDFSYCTYLSDLAVDVAHQRQGIGRELLRFAHEAAGLGTTLILLAAPKAQSYYPHIGMTQHQSCWTKAPQQQ